MITKNVRKTAYYLRATQSSKPFDLEAVIRACRQVNSSVATSEALVGAEDIVRIQHYKEAADGTYLHLVSYIPGEKAPTLRPKVVAADDNESAQTAPVGQEFKGKDCFFFISGHNVLYCGHGITIQKAKAYFFIFATKSNINGLNFELDASSNVDKLHLLKMHGVQSIEMSTSAYQASLMYEKPVGGLAGFFKKTFDEVKALVEKDEDAARLKAMEDLIVNVEVRLDGNTRASLHSKKAILKMATDALLDGDNDIGEFTIVTQNKDRIKVSDIRLQSAFNVERVDGSLSYSEVWQKLNAYYDGIKAANLQEQ